MNPNEIKALWSQRARGVTFDAQVTHRDVYQRQIEFEALSAHLRPEDVVLDVGCGNGWSTAQLASHCAHITGLDYSDAMIARARQEHPPAVNIDWRVGDVLTLADRDRYDAVTTTRCLINIVDWNLQQQAIRNIRRAIRPGGRFLMLEGVADGRAALSRLREQVGLPPLPVVPHNLDFDRHATLRFLEGLFARVELEADGLYDLITRVLYPHAIAPAEPEYNSALHRSAAALTAHVASWPELSRIGLFVCTKIDARRDHAPGAR